MPINGLTINQEKKIRAERQNANGIVGTNPYHLLAVAVRKYRRMQNVQGMSGQRERREALNEIDFWLDKLNIK